MFYRTIGVKQIDANKNNEWRIWKKMYSKHLGKYLIPKLKLGDYARVLKPKNGDSKINIYQISLR